jgi:hypothetical protein
MWRFFWATRRGGKRGREEVEFHPHQRWWRMSLGFVKLRDDALENRIQQNL